MRTSVRWSERAEEVNGIRPPINSVSYSPNGDFVVASCGVRVLLYSAASGTLVQSLKGHQDTVYSVDFSHDGKYFGSGGADHNVIVWSNKGEGIVKYQHKESIQCVANNPASSVMVSLSNCDWGLWSPDQSKVAKHPLPAKGLCCAWTQDGKHLAIGLIDGLIMVLQDGVSEVQRISRNAPIFSLAFNPIRTNGVDVLVVGSWDQRLSFYHLNGAPANRERELDFDPCSVSFYNNGKNILISGSDHKVSLYTNDGTRLATVVHAEDWIWCARQRPRHRHVCCGTNDGTLSCIEMTVTPVHSIYQDQYVFRDEMTNVIIHQLTLDRRMSIPCNDYVRRIAIHRDRLAVLFEERIVVFELFFDEERNMRYQDIAQIRKRFECDLMAIIEDAVVLCKGRRLTLYDLKGSKRREWSLDSPVTFMKVSGGPEGAETLLVGLRTGQALKIVVDNPFPIPLVQVKGLVRCVDFNSDRSRLVVVDDSKTMQVFNMASKKELEFSENDVVSAVYNTDYEDVLAYTTHGNMINIKTGSLPPYQQLSKGLVIGFKANRLFNLSASSVAVVDVPHSHALCRYVEAKDFDAAYKAATRGVTESDWKMLGMHAMTNLKLDVARRAFRHIKEGKFVELLNALELKRRQGAQSGESEEGTNTILQADVLAFQGKYQEASRQFIKCGHESRAIEMFSDLKMWDEARKVCSDEEHLRDIIRQQARWSEDSQNYIEAAELYEQCGDYNKAIAMMGQAGQVDKLMKTCRSLPKSEVSLITECANYFRQHNAIDYALEAYTKVGDNRSLIKLYVEMGDWKSAFQVLDKCPQYARDVYVPWATWLAENDKFEEALEAFSAAKWPKETIRMLETLASNSVTCRKFNEAAFHYTHLAYEIGLFEDDETPSDAQKAHRIRLSTECMRKAEIYFAYNFVYTHSTQPMQMDETRLFRISRFLLSVCSEGAIPMNVGKAEILSTLARTANRLEMVRTARAAFEKLQLVILPTNVLEQVDVETLLIRSKNFTDRDELLDVCPRCRQMVPQFTSPGDRCPNCQHPFVRCLVTFQALPLVEFTLSNDLTDEEAERMMVSGLGMSQAQDVVSAEEQAKAGTEWKADNGANVINFEAQNIDYQIDQELVAMGRANAAANKGGDPFFAQLQYVTRPGRPKTTYQPYVANAEMIKTFRRDELFIIKHRCGNLTVPNRYYRLTKRDKPLTLCQGCQRFFLGTAYEYECMKGNGCPICRFKPNKQVGRSLQDIMMSLDAEA